MINLFDELLKIVETLNHQGIDYALCGGLAYSFHVEMRATIDIDLLIRDADFERIRTVLEPLGYEKHSERMIYDQGKMVIDRLVKLIPEHREHLLLDFLLAEPLPDPTIWNDRMKTPWRGTEICLVTIEGLIKLKQSRMSDQDKVDIKHLELKLRNSR